MKEENIKGEYQRKVDKSLIPTCNIMGVNIAAINMNWLLKYLDENLSDIKGDYICVSNVHTTVTSYENAAYCAVQNGGLMAIPDGGPLSSVGRKRGYSDMDRTTGPSLMGEIFKISAEKGYRHYFYGSTEETLKLLEEKLQENYPGIQIAGMYSPPFRPLTEEEDKNIIENSPLNGTGLKPVIRTLKESGYTNITVVKEQEQPDGTFPTCPYPNPEVRQAMELGIEYAKKNNADLLLATDPDCDRVGIAVKNTQGEYAEYGYCLNTLHSYTFEGSAGFEKMQNIMVSFRKSITEFAGKKVLKCLDYTVSWMMWLQIRWGC